MTTNKYPEKTNLGGLWLMNPHAPRCHPSTNLDGANLAPAHQPQYGTTLHDHFGPGGTSWAGAASALPPAWKFHFPSNYLILTGNTLPETEDGPAWQPFRGTHILRTQRYREKEPMDGKCHPRFFRETLGYMPPVNHVAWYDSLTRRELDIPSLISETSPNGTYRGFFWSLYYGAFIQALPSEAPTVVGPRSWWMVAGLEPIDSRLIGVAAPAFRFFSLWRHFRPLADTTPNHAIDDVTPRFNPLGKNLFIRCTSDDGIPIPGGDTLTIEPFYG